MSQYHPILFFLQLGVLVSLGLAGYCAYRLRRHGRSLVVLSVGLLAVSIAIYNGAAAMKTASLALPGKLWWYKLEFLGSLALPSVAVTLALAYVGQERWLTRPVLAVLVGIPAVAVPLIIANPGSVMITEPTLVETGGFWALEHGHPPLFVMVAAWGEGATLLAALVVGGSGLFGNARRAPALILGAALGLPYGALMLKTLQVYPPGGEGINIVPAFASGMLVIVALAIARYRLFDLLPVGRSKAFGVMDDGYMLADATGTIVDANEAARTLLGEERLTARAVGEAISELRWPGATGGPVGTGDPVGAGNLVGADGQEEAADPVTATVEGRTLQMRSSSVRDGRKAVGRVFMLRDITPLREREQALKEENERLDRFASVLSHDLRNPLNVAQGRLQLAKEQLTKEVGSDPEGHVTSAERALRRMNEIIEDMLLLTWSEQELSPGDLGPVDLEAAARAAWDHVDAPKATLEVESSTRLRGHEGRLQRLLENLFRNAIEHGGKAVSVTVGALPDVQSPPGEQSLLGGQLPSKGTSSSGGLSSGGLSSGGLSSGGLSSGGLSSGGFFVEDDGPGIPVERREKVLEGGYSSREKGTGLGLSIVQGIAAAHGWSTLITEPVSESSTESQAGGARFEFRSDGMQGG
ncbi:histidine kinase N-terminal 7TM domain-containing protein [Salinibacter ruber]|uniref:histidine kinase N-terminal 7TM domain-containing protein n=1 Tax=Salinibacter ruber TaxID=146919 RepID=UPI002168C976|nr:histidine kinase N-terminal 7TM domain-containing protein [Salinibacter ruber]MCS4057912.1 signal transduction histidine kinase [Salinibacter ruber]